MSDTKPRLMLDYLPIKCKRYVIPTNSHRVFRCAVAIDAYQSEVIDIEILQLVSPGAKMRFYCGYDERHNIFVEMRDLAAPWDPRRIR